VIALRPSAYFAGHLVQLMEDIDSFDEGEDVARIALLPCASCLTQDQLEAVLGAWIEEPHCWGRAMSAYTLARTPDSPGTRRTPLTPEVAQRS
jgi:hypothetical protein